MAQGWVGRHERRRNDGKVLGDVIGDAEGGQGTAGDQHLLADLDNLDQLGRIGIQIHHVAGFLGGLGAAVHRHGHIGLGQSRRVIGAVARHRHQPALGLMLSDQRKLGFWRGLGEEVVHPGLGRNGRGSEPIVSGDHDGADAHPAQLGKAGANAALDDVLQRDHPQQAIALRNRQRRAAVACHGVGHVTDGSRNRPAGTFDPLRHGIDRPLAQLAIRQVHAAHARVRRKGNRLAIFQGHIRGSRVQPLPGEHHDAAPLRRLVGLRREPGHLGQMGRVNAGSGRQFGGLAVAQRDGAGLVEQQHVHITGSLDRPS